MKFITATPSDANTIAHLHAISWQQHYRNIFSDDYLDNDALTERTTLWKERLEIANPNQFVLLAKDDETLLGFVCIFKNYDDQWGAYLDNLHVSKSAQGRGIGKQLMQKAVDWLTQQNADSQFYLWVFEANTAARAFYKKLGGQEAEICPFDLKKHGGGSAPAVRVVWESLSHFK